MEQYLQPLMEYLRHHPQVGILFAFFTALIESLPLLGTLFPGAVTMTAIGALIGASVLPPIATCISAILGALLGDCLGFWLGDRYHEKIRQVWPLRKFNKYLLYSEKIFAKHGGKSIIIGRFIGPTRAAMPLIAGILRYTWRQFLPVAVFAATSWSLIYMAPGILLGALAMEFSHGDMTKVFFSGLVAIVGLWLIFWLLQYFFRQLSRAINRTIQIWWDWLNQPKPSIFARLIRNQHHPRDYRQLKLVLLWLLSSGLFLFVWISVTQHGWVTRANEPLFYLAQSFRSPTLDPFWVFMTTLGAPEALLISSLLTALGLIICKQWRAGMHIALLGLISASAIETIKKLYFSARPGQFMLVEHSSSFPSGHTTMSVAVLGFLAFLTAKIIPRGWRSLSYTFFITLTLLISASRLFLGQHWVSDILGAWLLGLSLLLLAILSYRRMPQTRSMLKIAKKRWLGIIAISTLFPWLGAMLLTFQNTLMDTQPIWPTTLLNFQQWWQQPTKSVPLYRPDRFGQLAQPFNVQWAGTLEDIQAFLLRRGWQLTEQGSRMHDTLQRFTSLAPEHNTPLLPWLYQNQPPIAFFIKHLDNSQDILELQLWRSGIHYIDSPLPLWLGILTYHTPPEKILRFPHRYIHLQSGDVLIDVPPQRNDIEFQLVHITTAQQPETIRDLNWNGEVFVLRPMNKHSS